MAKPLFSFGVISDCQYADIPDDNEFTDRRFRLAKNKLAEAITFFNAHDLAFVVHLGDLIDRDLASFDTILPMCEKSKAPFWHVLGNHDFKDAHNGRLDPRVVIKRIGLEQPYYSKQIQNYRFIILDTNEEGLIEAVPGTDAWEKGQKVLDYYKSIGRVNAQRWNGRIGSKQHSWLISQLEDAAAKDEKCIIFSHHGIYPKHRENALNDEEILEELKLFPQLKAYINGHNHDGNYGHIGHLHCLNIRGMVDTGQNSYALAHVYLDKIMIEGFGREPSRVMQY